MQGPIINVHAEISSDARDLKLVFINAPDRGQLKTPLTIDKCGSKIARNSVVDCHLSPVRGQMATENSVSNYFDLRLSIVTYTVQAAKALASLH